MKLFSTDRNRYGLFKSYLTVFLFSGISLSCFSQIDFAPFVTYTTGSKADVVCIGDVNNDGLNDVALCTKKMADEEDTNDYTLFIYLQNAFGNLAPPVKYSYPDVYYRGFTSIAINDINNDGLNDVVIGYSDSLAVFYQNNAGMLNDAQLIYGGVVDGIDGISIGDLNNDQLNDIALSYWSGLHISVLYQTPVAGRFITATYPAPQSAGYNQIEVADINSDMLSDVVLMIGQYLGGIHVYTQNNTGTFNDVVSYIDFPHQHGCLGGIGIGDLNNDGRNDIAKNIWGNYDYARIALVFQDGSSGQLQAPVFFPTGNAPEIVKISDLDCNGRKDILVTHSGSRFSVFEQDTDGEYTTSTVFSLPYATHLYPMEVSVGDINNDGRDDVAIANYNSGLVVLINQSSVNGSFLRHVTTTAGQTVCQDDIVAVYKISHPPTEEIIWNIFPAEAGNIIFSNNDSCEIAWNNDWRGQAGIYGVVVNKCVSAYSDTFFIDIGRLPDLDLGNDTAFCVNSSIELFASSGFNSYTWQDNSHDAAYTVTEGGTYSVEAAHVCGTQYDTVVVEEVNPPVINLAQDTILCAGTTMQFDVSLPGNNQYHWQDGTDSPVYLVDQSGTYSVEITDEYQCFNSASITVQELQAPVLTWPADTTICSINTLTLRADNPASQYQWQDGSDLTYYLVTAGGFYSVEVTNDCGSAIASTFVTMEECPCYLDVPSAFSPNGDEVNDVLYAVGLNVDQVHFVIYNRWGQKVFESFSLSGGWDGKFLNQNMDTGVYVYSVTARSISDGHVLEKKGNITLIR